MINKKLRIGFDVDGVLLDFWTQVCTIFDKPIYSTSWDNDWIVENWFKIENNDLLWRSLNYLSLPQSITNLKYVEAICYITACPSKQKLNRIHNLQELGFPLLPVEFVEPNTSKLEVIKRYNLDIFVDDKPATIKELMENWNGNVIQFIPYYANYDTYKVEGSTTISHLGEIDLLIENNII